MDFDELRVADIDLIYIRLHTGSDARWDNEIIKKLYRPIVLTENELLERRDEKLWFASAAVEGWGCIKSVGVWAEGWELLAWLVVDCQSEKGDQLGLTLGEYFDIEFQTGSR